MGDLSKRSVCLETCTCVLIFCVYILSNIFGLEFFDLESEHFSEEGMSSLYMLRIKFIVKREL